MYILRLQFVIIHTLHLKRVFCICGLYRRLHTHIQNDWWYLLSEVHQWIVTCESLWAHVLHLKGVMECTSLDINV